ncbi:unnamed protein product [Colias eurytheme]|nr:unnamed protein product [Colias eurytheme]
MHKKTKNEPLNIVLKLTYLRYRNFCNNLLKRLKLEYEKKTFNEAGKDAKKMWEAVRGALDITKSTSPPTELLKSNVDPLESVNLINSFFANVGTDLASKISFNPQCINALKPHLPIHSPQLNSIVFLETDESEVDLLIGNLRVDCSSGWDGISAKLLKASRHILVPPITYICNMSLSLGIFPQALKKAVVHPVYKSGDRDSVNNYRPISVLPIISKILERIIYKQLLNYTNKYNIIARNQFGFRKGLSTEDAVSALVESVIGNLDSKLKCISIFLDLSKAFDTVSVPILLRKLDKIGIRGTAYKLIKDFLSNRTQCVKIGDHISREEVVTCGVPQGSLLSPLLFQIYVNELCQLVLPSTKVIAYADDTALIAVGKDWSETKKVAEYSLSVIMSWFASNSLTLNIQKTCFVTFGPRQSSLPDENSYTLTAHSCTSQRNCHCPSVNRTASVKYLGVHLDACLTWKPHIEAVSSRIRKLIFVFKKLRLAAHRDILKMVYSALCESIVSYCITVWGGSSKSSIIQAERAQRAVIKTLLNKPFRYPTEQVYSQFVVMTVRQFYVYRTVLRKHGTLSPKQVSTSAPKRRTLPCPKIFTKTKFAKNFYPYLSTEIYNTLDKN